MTEKTIILRDISCVDFLGVENQNIKTLSERFPESKILSRGDKITIKGAENQINTIHNILLSLLDHYHIDGGISQEKVKEVSDSNHKDMIEPKSKGKVIVHGVNGSTIIAKTKNQQLLVEVVKKKDLVFITGPAGTGKTFLSVALAIKALKNKSIKKIIITRPVVESGEHLGFLPGDLQEKIDPYLRPIYDALSKLITKEKLKYYKENSIIEIAPLAYMRGRTLENAYVLLDEAQNTSPTQLKMFLTRMGANSKMLITGDISQIDLPKKQHSGLADAIGILKDVEGVDFITLQATDVMRHHLVKNIISAYEKGNV